MSEWSNPKHNFSSLASHPALQTKERDDLLLARVTKKSDGRLFCGAIVQVGVGKRSSERLYLIKYSDGDCQHVTESEARAALAAWAIDSIGDTAVETGISAISDGTRLAAAMVPAMVVTGSAYVYDRAKRAKSFFTVGQDQRGLGHTIFYSNVW